MFSIELRHLWRWCGLATSLCLLGLLGFLCAWSVGAAGMPVDAPTAELHVCPAGPPTCDYASLQAAVDAAGDGDLVKVAAGTYIGVQGRAAPPGYFGPSVITQVVYLTKSLSIQGGYTTANWDVPDPEANPTVLDAEGQGRVFFVAGTISPTVAGLGLTGGDAAGLTGHPWAAGSDTGGGMHVMSATITVENCRVWGNTVRGFGGGIYLGPASDATIVESEVLSNTATWGGGICLYGAAADLVDDTIAGNAVDQVDAPGGNIVPNRGGGLDAMGRGSMSANLSMQGNTISGNNAEAKGGGLSLTSNTTATVSDNLITANSAITGGGLYVQENYAELAGNTISQNSATYGGGVAIEHGAPTLDQNTLAGNTADQDGGGVWLRFEHYAGGGASFIGNTFQANVAGLTGGGLATRNADVVIQSNTFTGNSAISGGGMDLFGSSGTVVQDNLVSGNLAGGGAGVRTGMFDGTLESNRILSNVADHNGGGLEVFGGGTWTNNVIADNQAGGSGSALYMKQGQLDMRHTTLARNSGGDGNALYLTAAAPFPGASEVTMYNTILADHSTGIEVTEGSTLTVDAVLWYNTPTTVTVAPDSTALVQHQYTGDPAFAADGYHLQVGSAALDIGVDAGVADDIDGDARPAGAGPDLGADELVLYDVYLPILFKISTP